MFALALILMITCSIYLLFDLAVLITSDSAADRVMAGMAVLHIPLLISLVTVLSILLGQL